MGASPAIAALWIWIFSSPSFRLHLHFSSFLISFRYLGLFLLSTTRILLSLSLSAAIRAPLFLCHQKSSLTTKESAIPVSLESSSFVLSYDQFDCLPLIKCLRRLTRESEQSELKLEYHDVQEGQWHLQRSSDETLKAMQNGR